MPPPSDLEVDAPSGEQKEEVRAEPRELSLARRLFTGPPPPVEPAPVQVPPVEPAPAEPSEPEEPAPVSRPAAPPPVMRAPPLPSGKRREPTSRPSTKVAAAREQPRSVPPPVPKFPVSASIARITKEPDRYTGPPPPVHPVSAQIARIIEDTDGLTGPPPPMRAIERATGVEEAPKPVASRPPPPPPRPTMEVQMAWLDAPSNEPRAETATPVAGEVAEPFVDDEAPTTLKRKPPRIPGANRTFPPMPLDSTPTKPPPPPRRQTQQVEMAWVELVDDDLVEEPSSGTLPTDQAESTESLPSIDVSMSTGALPPLPESSGQLPALPEDGHAEGPPISDTLRAARLQDATATAKHPALDEEKLAEEAAKKARLSEFLQATSASIPPGALAVSDLDVGDAGDAELESMREDALAARKREQDERDREIRERRRAERERERLELEAKKARVEVEQREEAERAAALRQGRQNHQLLDLSDDLSNIDDEIDTALDAVLGPNLSYPPPAPDDDESKPE